MIFKKSLLLLMTLAAAFSSNGKTRDIASDQKNITDKGKAVTVNQIFAGPWSVCLDERLSPEIVRSNSIRDFRMTSIKPDENGRIDFTIIRKNIPVRSKAAAFREIESDSEQTIMLGFLCDWWGALYLNGEPVFDCLKTGSGKVRTFYGRPLQCTLKKGKNVFAVFLMAGSLGCSFNIGFLPNRIKVNEETLPEVISYFYKESPRELYSLPWISDAGTDTVTIKVAAKSLCSAAIQYQEAGSGEKAVIRENARWGQSVLAKFHQIRLTSLKPGTRYQYFLLLRWGDNEGTVQKLGPFYFRTFPETMKEYTILLTADTQFAAQEQKKIFSRFAEKGLFRDGDLFIHLGDVQSSFSDFSKQFAGTFLTSLQPYAGTELPIMVARGNHEFCGEETLSFAEFAGKPYESFVMGDVFYLKLDSGWNPESFKKFFQWRDHTEDYMKEQKIWLEKTVASDAWKKARYHIVLCHATPCYDFSFSITRNMKMLAGDLFLGKNPREKIDLWICGHTHSAARFDVKTQKFLTAAPFKHHCFFDEQKKYMVEQNDRGYPMDYICLPFDYVPFPVMVMDGPWGVVNLSLMRLKATPNGLSLKHYNTAGNLIDDIEIAPNHEFKVIGTKMRPVAEQQEKLR